MQKGYYISFGHRISIGVDKKIEMQLRQLRKYANIDFIQVVPRRRNGWSKLLNLLPWVANKWDFDWLYDNIHSPDFIYVRRIEADKKYVKFFCKIKCTYPKCKILLEIPTYPYEREYWWSADMFFLIKDMIYRRKIFKYVDRIVTYSADESMWGIPTIRVQNGVETKEIEIVNKKTFCRKEIHLICVAFFQKHHGYERIIKGINNYYKNEKSESRKIVFHMVGEGKEKQKYEDLVKDMKLEGNVLFHGMLQGRELDKIFDQCDIALSVFGMYKQKSNFTSPIKTMEYLAKGLPVISGCAESAFQSFKPRFYLEFANDSTDIDMERIVKFYDTLYFPDGNEKLRNEIREFAVHNIDMSLVMKPIIEFLLDHNRI